MRALAHCIHDALRDIEGFGGGGSSSNSGQGSVESPDNLQSIAYAQILDLWCEGEIQGFAHPSNVLQDVALNGTSVANADGTLNFKNVKFDSRTGTQTQGFMSGFPDVENETAVGVELRDSAAWTQSLTDITLTAVRVRLSMPSIQKENTSTGDITGYTVQYAIDIATDGGSFMQAITSAFTGKSTSQYERAHRIELPTATTGWTVRVRRLTANQNLATVSDTMMVASYTGIIDGKFRYPNSAYGGIIIDASQFNAIPTRAYNLYGRIVSIPSNYDPNARTYTGAWDGTFKQGWTNNPAWIFYDLITNNRFGLGAFVSASRVNKWALYTIAQYCDEIVPDGFGGTEPRMTCNVYIQSQADAYKVLQDLATVFRGVAYWAAGAVQAQADMPGDPVYTYTAANVIGGKFTYQGSGRTTRFTTALVSWNDQSDFGRSKVEYVSDDVGIARYGIQNTSVTGFGCTSRGQAHRIGLWTLLTSRLETGTVTFQVGLDGTIAAPGQIIRVLDPARAGKRQAGRIRAATATAITVDAAPTVAVGDTLTCTLPSGVTESHAVTAIAGNVISVAAPGFSTVPNAEAIWLVESAALVAETYRVIGVVEDGQGEQLSFTITALLHNASKFDAIDFGDAISIPPVSVIPPSTQPGPASVTLTSNETAGNVNSGILLHIAWPSTSNAVKYTVEWRKDNGEWNSLGIFTGLGADIHNAKAGVYTARVRAINAGGVGSVPTVSADYAVADQLTQPTSIALTQNGFASEIVDNATFLLPVDASGNIPGWRSFQGGALSYIVSAHYNNANIMTMQGSVANGGAESVRKYACKAGDYISVTADLFTVTTAGSLGRIQVHFYRADGTDFTEGSGNFSAANTTYQTWQTLNAKGVVPTNAAWFTIVFYNPTTTGTAWQFHCMNVRLSINDVRVQGSGATVGNQGNLVPINWNGVRSVLNTSPLTYSINTASPATLTFSCAAVTIRGGSFSVSYNASSGSTTQARNTTQTYYFYYIDTASAGGSQTLHFTTNIYDLSAQDGIVNIGNCSITVPSSGGGSGAGGGGGGWCVCDEMWVDDETQARDALPGHVFDCCDLPRQGLATFRRALESVERQDTDCVRLTTDGGAQWEGGASTPFDTIDGRQLYAVQMVGELVLTDQGLQRVVSVRRLGVRPVCFFHFGGISYAAGRDTRPLWIRIFPQSLLPRRFRRRVNRVFSHNLGGTIAKP